MNRYNSLLIIDFDDSIFPTTFITSNKINIRDIKQRELYKVMFSELDNTIYMLLNEMIKYCKILIVTNASKSWANTALNMIPNTCSFVNTHINIVSVRDIYENKYPDKIYDWKQIWFINHIQPDILNLKTKNIISIGDGISEFKALVNLAMNNNQKGVYFKSVRMMTNPSLKLLIDQINVIVSCTKDIVVEKKYRDLIFHKKNIIV